MSTVVKILLDIHQSFEADIDAGEARDSFDGHEHARHKRRPISAILSYRQCLSCRSENDFLMGKHSFHPDTMNRNVPLCFSSSCTLQG